MSTATEPLPTCVEIIVPTLPVAQPRPRAGLRGNHAMIYQPKSHPVVVFKSSVQMAAREVLRGRPPRRGPLGVDCVFVFPRTQNQIWKRKPMPRMRHIKKPDRDNLDKAVLDALTGIAWADDRQVCAGSIEKWIASGDEQPHVVIRIYEVEETNGNN